MAVRDGRVHGADAEVVLRPAGGTLTDVLGPEAAHRDGVRHLAGRAALAVATADGVDARPHPNAGSIPEAGSMPAASHPLGWLAGQLVVSAVDPEGRLAAATGVQTALALDGVAAAALDAAAASRGVALGPTWDARGVPVVRVWAPTARAVRLHRRPAPGWPRRGSGSRDVHDMTRGDHGVWSATGTPAWHGDAYRFEVTVYDPVEDRVVTDLVTDPWSVALTADGWWSVLADLDRLDDPTLAPRGWAAGTTKPAFAGHARTVLYELHLRDLSATDPSMPEALRGTYLALTLPGSHGIRHLRRLAEAGVTHLHLLPVHDMGSVPERRSDQVTPRIRWPDDPADEAPQRVQQASVDRQAYNWGYDPQHTRVPEGSYATEPDGPQRIAELRAMVAAVNRLGLRVVVDLVCNHTYRAGRHPRSVLDRLVPGYYHRLDDLGRVTTSTCCPNTATEHVMMERLVLDTVLTWARAYRVDGFRFDLLGHHPAAQARRIRAAMDALTVEADGVEGCDLVLYGEGWEFGEVAGNARFDQATQVGLAGTGIGTFDDRLRDAVRGGNHVGSRRDQGFASGLWWEPNDRTDLPGGGNGPGHGNGPASGSGTERGSAEQLRAAHELTDRVRLGIAGNLADVAIPCADGLIRLGRELRYGDAPAGYTLLPREQVAYVSAHDNETLFDALAAKLPVTTSMSDRVRMQVVALSTVLLGQGISFLHAGSELLRSRSLDRDSYRSGDWFNAVDWQGQRTRWGAGLPPASSNPDERELLTKLLRSIPPPEAAHITTCRDRVLELLQVRASSRLFGLPDAAAVRSRLRFHLTGPQAVPGVVVWSLNGARLVDHDLLLVINAAPVPLEASWDELAGEPTPSAGPGAALDAGGRGPRAAGPSSHRDLGDRAVPWTPHPALTRSVDPGLRRSEAGRTGLRVAARTTMVFRRRAH